MDKISLVIPCYNEEDSLPFLKEELEKIINKMNDVEFEIIMVDNCSEDNTLNIMKEYHKIDKKYKYISFSRNFGKEASMYAGLKMSSVDYVAIMDADLQDPPSLLIDMYNTIKRENYDCVAAYQEARKGESKLRTLFANIFYKLIKKVSKLEIKNGARDYRLMSRQMVNSILSLNEVERFSKGIFVWVGFKTKWIAFKGQERVAGKTKLPIKSATKYAISGITSFSSIPLVASFVVGLIFCISSIIYILFVIINHLINGNNIIPGYSSLMCVILLGFGLTLLVLGIIGKYLSTIYLEIKKRPLYIIKETSISNKNID